MSGLQEYLLGNSQGSACSRFGKHPNVLLLLNFVWLHGAFREYEFDTKGEPPLGGKSRAIRLCQPRFYASSTGKC